MAAGTHEVTGLESALHRCALFCLIESESPVLLRAKGPESGAGRYAAMHTASSVAVQESPQLSELHRKSACPHAAKPPWRPRKKARSLPTGPKSFGRGCLKGHFHMQLPSLLRKCEMSGSGCIFYNSGRLKPQKCWKSETIQIFGPEPRALPFENEIRSSGAAQHSCLSGRDTGISAPAAAAPSIYQAVHAIRRPV